MERLLLLFLLAIASESNHAVDTTRFQGEGRLTKAAVESTDGRFTLQANLLSNNEPQLTARFSLNASLQAGVHNQSIAAICAPGLLFSDSFE